MNRSVFWALVRKDLYLQRGLIVGMLTGGLLGLALFVAGSVYKAVGGAGVAVGGILFMTANVAGGIFLAMFTLLADRKELTRLFALSLPISGSRYAQSKLVGGYVAFLIPWVVLTVLAAVVFLPSPAPMRGMLVYALLIQFFVLALFSVVVGALFVVSSELASGLLILAVNILFSLFMVAINQPATIAPFRGPVIHWTPFAVWMFGGELLVTVLAIFFALSLAARRRDHL